MLLGQLLGENLGRRGAAGHRSLLELSHQQVRKWWCGTQMAFGSTSNARQGIAFGSTWDALESWGVTAIAKGFCQGENSSSASVQQVQGLSLF